MMPNRRERIESVLARRQPGLSVILENVHDPHNVGAILRSCDAFGVLDVHLLYTTQKAPKMSELRSKSAASSVKWLRITKWNSAKKLAVHLHRKGFQIAATHLGEKSRDPAKTNLTKPTAIAIGNEHEGISEELLKLSDVNIRLPQVGFVQSFNVSVAAALLLYEAYRQREKKGMYEKPQFKPAEFKKMLREFE